MFDISEKLIAEQSDEIYGVNTIYWCDSALKHLSLVNDEEVTVSRAQKFTYFADSVLRLGKMSENPKSNVVWDLVDLVQRVSSELSDQLVISNTSATAPLILSLLTEMTIWRRNQCFAYCH